MTDAARRLTALPSQVAVLRRLDMYLPAPDRPLVERVHALLTGRLANDDQVREHEVIVEAPNRVRVVGPTGRRGYDVVFMLGDPAVLDRRAVRRAMERDGARESMEFIGAR